MDCCISALNLSLQPGVNKVGEFHPNTMTVVIYFAFGWYPVLIKILHFSIACCETSLPALRNRLKWLGINFAVYPCELPWEKSFLQWKRAQQAKRNKSVLQYLWLCYKQTSVSVEVMGHQTLLDGKLLWSVNHHFFVSSLVMSWYNHKVCGGMF